jgi:hypothetical protein
MQELRQLRETLQQLISIVRADPASCRQSIEFDLARVEAELLSGEALLEEGDELSLRVLLPRLCRLLRQVAVSLGMDGFSGISEALKSLNRVETQIIAAGKPDSTPILEGLGI